MAQIQGWQAVSNYLGISVSTARRMHRESDLPIERSNGRIHASKTSLRTWKNSRLRPARLIHARSSKANEILRGTIRAERQRQRISMRRMAKAIGVSTTTYFEVESGRCRISVDRLDQIIRVLNLRITDVWPTLK